MDPLSLGLGLASAGSSFVQNLFGESEAQRNKKNAIKALKKLLIPQQDTVERADRAGDTLYTKTMSELNQGVFSARGVLNPDTLKTIAHSKMGIARAMTEQNIEEQDLQFNRAIQAKIAGVEAQPTPGINPAEIISEGVGGYLAGKQLGMQLDLVDTQKSYMNSLINGNRGTNVPNRALFEPNALFPSKKMTPVSLNFSKINPKNRHLTRKQNKWIGYQNG